MMEILVYDIKDKERWDIALKPGGADKEYPVAAVSYCMGEEVLFEVSREIRDRYSHPLLNQAYNTIAIESDNFIYIEDDIEYIKIS